MGKYVKVHPNMEGQPAPEDFESGGNTWSHVIEDQTGDPVFFGLIDFGSKGNLEEIYFAFSAPSASGHRFFTWAQAREFAETIIALADKHEILPTRGIGTDRPCNRPFMGKE